MTKNTVELDKTVKKPQNYQDGCLKTDLYLLLKNPALSIYHPEDSG